MVANTNVGERYEQIDDRVQKMGERVAEIERELETERPHLATKADLRGEIAVLRRDVRWGLLLLAIIAAGEWLPQIRSLF